MAAKGKKTQCANCGKAFVRGKTSERSHCSVACRKALQCSKPPRPCLSCGRTFQPTPKRWVLCQYCFTRGGESAMA